MTQEPTKATREAMGSLSVGDEITINRTGKHMNGGTYTITAVEGERNYKVTDEKGREGVLVRTYDGQNRIHIENGPRRNFTWMRVE